MMDQALFWLTNTSTSEQEVNLFNSNDQNGKGTSVAWNFTLDWNGLFDGANWFKSATLAPIIRLQYTRTDGVTATQTETDISLVGDTTAQLETYFNANLSNFGTWSIINISGTNATIRCVLKDDATATGGIDTNASTKGAVALSLIDDSGGGPGTTVRTSTASTNPDNFYEGLKDNPNIKISSYTTFTYNQFLWSVAQRTYDIKKFEVFSETKGQLFQPFLFDRKTAVGKTFQKVIVPTMDPYQGVDNYVITPDKKGYILDGFTTLKYNMDGSALMRLVMDYTYIDLATPLMYDRVSPDFNLEDLPPVFVTNMRAGYEKYGCNYLHSKYRDLNQKLVKVAGVTGRQNLQWQHEIKQRLAFIQHMMVDYYCIDDKYKEIPNYGSFRVRYKKKNLWMPSTAFVDHQIKVEQGIGQLYKTPDFPIEK